MRVGRECLSLHLEKGLKEENSVRLNMLVLSGLLAVAAIAAACSKPASENLSNAPAKTPNKNEQAAANLNKNPAGEAQQEEVPAQVKAAFPEAQSVSLQHKDLTSGQISSIEKEAGAKLADSDFHSFVAHDSSHKQIGSATLTEVEGAGEPAQLLVVYTNDVTINKVTPLKGSGDVVSPSFLDQFVGLDHHSVFHVGDDLKYDGANKDAAQAVAHAVKRDVLAMQALYGKKHGH